MTGLGFIGGGGINPFSYASAISADGSVVVGYSVNPNNQVEAFRWASGTMIGLSFIGGGGSSPHSHAKVVSADGMVVAGQSQNPRPRGQSLT